MNSLHTTLQQIAAILSFEVDTNELKTMLLEDNVNWDNIVKVGSAHLILTTIYCRLKQKSLLHSLPKELNIYLNELSTINRNRNTTILEEVKILSNIFNKNKIKHVFLKGTALLAANLYNDYNERMIGDIDVLVQDNQTTEAYNLLMENHYYPLKVDPDRKYIKHRHLNRLIPENGLAAVEIHHTLLARKYKDYLNPSNILKFKQLVNGIYVPSNLELLHHNILSNQLNDFGNLYKVINLKSSYDSILLLKNQPNLNFKSLLSDSVFKNYFLLLQPFFRETPIWKLSNLDRIRLYLNLLKLKYWFISLFNKVIIQSYIFTVSLFMHIKIVLKHKEHIHFLISRLKKNSNNEEY